jgi:hypothetical protein
MLAKTDGITNARRTLMLFELLADADGAGAEDELEDGESPPYWALTKAGRSTAVKAIENFMVRG